MSAIPTRRAGLLFLTVFLLNACTTIVKTPVTEQSLKNWAKYQLEVSRIDNWDLHGRVAVFANDEVHNIGLSWRHNVDEFLMILEAPFGQGVIRLESNHGAGLEVKLSLPDGRTVYAETAESALEKVVGWPIPVSGLKSWIRGLPQNKSRFSHELNGDGRLISLQQNDWRIDYLDYFGFEEPARGLPRKLYLKHTRLALKIVIEYWQKPEVNSGETNLFPDFN